MNGDLLTKVNFVHLIDFHRDQKAVATMCIREHNMQVPYGVVETDEHWIVRITEKPVERYFINAGIYVLDPNALKHIPQDTFFDMPDLFGCLIEENSATAVFPVRDYWLDVGQRADLEQARGQ